MDLNTEENRESYTLNFADPIFERIFREEKGFDIVANLVRQTSINSVISHHKSAAHKHVRSEMLRQVQQPDRRQAVTELVEVHHPASQLAA